MKEEELAELFGRELDAAISGGGEAARSSADPLAMETALRLARADFSGESRIRATLRAELAGGESWSDILERLARLFKRSAWLQVAAGAACLTLVMLPLMREERAPSPSAAPSVRADLALPVSSAAAAGAPKAAPAIVAAGTAPAPSVPASALPAGPAEAGIFHSIPMASLSGGRAREFPIESRKGASPFGRAKVRKVSLPKGSGMVWETERAVFTIETREISREELFRRKAI